MDRRDLLKLFALSPLAPAAAKAAAEDPEVSWTWEAGGRSATVHVPPLKGEVLLVGGLESHDPQLPILDASYVPIGHVLLEPNGISLFKTSISIQVMSPTVIACHGQEFDLFSWMPFSGGRYVTVVRPMVVVNQ